MNRKETLKSLSICLLGSDMSVSRSTLFMPTTWYLPLIVFKPDWVIEFKKNDEHQYFFVCQRESNGVPHWNRIETRWGYKLMMFINQSMSERILHLGTTWWVITPRRENRSVDIFQQDRSPGTGWVFSRWIYFSVISQAQILFQATFADISLIPADSHSKYFEKR